MITHLHHGAHGSPEEGMCLMEAVAYLASEPHSDTPVCSSRVIAAFGRAWNDALGDEDRDRLLLDLPQRIIGTGPLAEDQEHALSLAVLDWYCRTWLPTWLDLVPALREHAAALRAHEVVTDANAASCGSLVRAAGAAAGAAARAAAGDAAWAAAGAAAWDAAWAAARAAAWAAAGAAAWDAARAAARAAAWAAAWDAARAAAGDAAWAVLRPTVETLQQSARDLLIHLCDEARLMREEATR